MGGVYMVPGVQTPHFDNALDVYTKAANLGQIQQEKQLRDQSIQENSIKLQQAAQAQADQTKFDALWRQNNGDTSAALAAAPAAGVSSNHVMAVQKIYQDYKDKLAQNTKTQNDINAQNGDLLAGRIKYVAGLPIEQQAPAYQSQMTDAIAKGEVKADDPLMPKTWQGADWATQYLPVLIGHAKASKEVADAQKATDEHLAAQNTAKEVAARLPGIDADSQGKVTKGAADELSAAQSQDDWNKVIAKYPGSDKTFGAIYSPSAVQRAADIGTSPAERARIAELKQQHEDTAAYRAQPKSEIEFAADAADPTSPTRQQSQATLDKMTETRLAGLKSSAGGNLTTIRPLVTKEGQLNRMRSSLGNAITSGKVYVDRLGNMKPMTVASGGDEEVAATLVDEMKNRFHDVTDELKNTIEEKNNAISKAGGTVGVSTEQAAAALDAGTQKLFGDGTAKKTNGKTATPAATPPAAVTPKPAVSGPPVSMLTEGKATTFKNGQIWTLRNGTPQYLGLK